MSAEPVRLPDACFRQKASPPERPAAVECGRPLDLTQDEVFVHPGLRKSFPLRGLVYRRWGILHHCGRGRPGERPFGAGDQPAPTTHLRMAHPRNAYQVAVLRSLKLRTDTPTASRFHLRVKSSVRIKY